MKIYSPGDLLEVKIEKLSSGGDGVARSEQLVIFVPFTAPNDQLKIKLTEVKKNFARGEIVEVLRPSSLRVSPPCSYYGDCGGCNWQHLNAETQSEQKQLLVQEQLQKALGSSVPISDLMRPLFSSPKAFEYRTRIQLHYENGRFGFFSRKSHRLIEVDSCAIAEKALNQRLTELRKSPPRPSRPNNANSGAAVGSAKSENSERLELSLNQDGSVREGWNLEAHIPHDFSQVNAGVNQALIQSVVEKYVKTPTTKFVDLYCGAGNFSFPLFQSKSKSTGLGVELSPTSIQRAQKLGQSLKINHQFLNFYCSDVEKWIQRNSLPAEAFVLIDPPRIGLSNKTAKWIGELAPKHLAYVSCNPSTLARDLKIILESSKNQLQIKSIETYDMFPQTDHVEVLVWMES